jgi:hypothetical protein
MISYRVLIVPQSICREAENRTLRTRLPNIMVLMPSLMYPRASLRPCSFLITSFCLGIGS